MNQENTNLYLHAKKMSRWFLITLFAHIPVFLATATYFDVARIPVLILSGLIIAGPLLHYLYFFDHVKTPMLIAFATLCYTGILIHCGRGMIAFPCIYFYWCIGSLWINFSSINRSRNYCGSPCRSIFLAAF